MSSIRKAVASINPAKLAFVIAVLWAVLAWTVALAAPAQQPQASFPAELPGWVIPAALVVAGFFLRHVFPVLAAFAARMLNRSKLSNDHIDTIKGVAEEAYWLLEVAAKKSPGDYDNKAAAALKIFVDKLGRKPTKPEIKVAEDTFATVAKGSIQLVNKG